MCLGKLLASYHTWNFLREPMLFFSKVLSRLSEKLQMPKCILLSFN